MIYENFKMVSQLVVGSKYVWIYNCFMSTWFVYWKCWRHQSSKTVLSRWFCVQEDWRKLVMIQCEEVQVKSWRFYVLTLTMARLAGMIFGCLWFCFFFSSFVFSVFVGDQYLKYTFAFCYFESLDCEGGNDSWVAIWIQKHLVFVYTWIGLIKDASSLVC